MIGALQPSRLTSAWHVILLASCIGLGLSAAAGRADSYPAGSRPTIGGADTASATGTPGVAAGLTDGARADAARLAVYLRLHYAFGDRLIALSPLAAYVAVTRPAESGAAGVQGTKSSTAAPWPTTAVAEGGAPRVP